MSTVVALAWPMTGIACYHWARRSWISRWGTGDEPLCYPIAALFGPAAISFVIGEILCRRDLRK